MPSADTTPQLTLDTFEDASKRVKEVTQETKLIYSPHFSKETGNDVYLKPENMQRTGAYKVLFLVRVGCADYYYAHEVYLGIGGYHLKERIAEMMKGSFFCGRPNTHSCLPPCITAWNG